MNNQDENGETLLHLACWKNNILDIKKLLTDNIDVNIKNNEGETAIFNAVTFGDITAVKLLVEYNADIHTKNSDLDTLLHAACWNEKHNVEIISFLKSYIDINVQNAHGETLMDIAYMTKNKKLIEFCKQFTNDNLWNKEPDI